MIDMAGGAKNPSEAARAPARRSRGGPSKATLGRVKLAAIALSAVAFVGSLAGVIRATPNTVKPQVASGAAAEQVTIAQVRPVAPQRPSFVAPQAPDQSGLVLPVRPQMPTLRPFARTRGS